MVSPSAGLERSAVGAVASGPTGVTSSMRTASAMTYSLALPELSESSTTSVPLLMVTLAEITWNFNPESTWSATGVNF